MRIPSLSPLVPVALLLATAAYAAPDAPSGRVLIDYAPGAGAAVRDAVLADHGQVHYQFDRIGALAVSIDEATAAHLALHPGVLSMEPDAKRYLAAKPLALNDETTAQETPYGIERVQAPLVWAEGYEGEGVTVCIIDTGLYVDPDPGDGEAYGHEDLDGHFVIGGLDQTDDSYWFYDGYGHGTHVAGTVTAADNEVGVVGVSPGKVSLFAVKIFGDDGLWTYSSDLVAAAFACADNGADIINMSLSGSSGPNAERKAFDALYYEDGILSVAAASNDGRRQRVFPASYDSVISVAATDSDNVVADFSNQNQWVELAAPGVGVLSTVPLYVSDSWLLVGDDAYAGSPMEFAPYGTVTGELADGGLCLPTTEPGEWDGMVVVCERGDATFAEKVAHVIGGGGSATAIYDNEDAPLFLGTLGEPGEWIPTLSLTRADGLDALPSAGETATVVSAPFVAAGSSYEAWGGTSMATPHVAGVAALLWSARPNATNAEIRAAMTATALDLGEPGRDIAYGYGLVQAYDALQYLLQSTSPGQGPKKP